MSELEKKDVNEMDAAEMLEGYRAENPAAGGRREKAAEDWAREMLREFEGDARRWHHRQGWEACGLALLSAVTAMSCGAALIGGNWMPIVACIGISNVAMAGAWMQKAKAGWSA